MLISGWLVACVRLPATRPAPTFVPPTPKPLETVKVERRPLEEWVEARGYISSEREEELYFPIGGYIKSNDSGEQVKAGDRVKAGTVLAEIDAWELEVQLAKARLDLQIMELRHKAGEPLSDLEEQIYQLQLAYQQFYVDGLQKRFDRTKLVAPFDGLVQSLDAKPGKRVEPYQVVAVMIDPDALLVKAMVPEAYRGQVMAGQPVSVTLHVSPSQSWPAYVLDVSPSATIQTGGTFFEAAIAFDSGTTVPASYKMACTARILVNKGPEALFLPARALIWEGTKAYVEREVDGQRSRHEIVAGKRIGDWVEIVAGLREGQTVYIPQK